MDRAEGSDALSLTTLVEHEDIRPLLDLLVPPCERNFEAPLLVPRGRPDPRLIGTAFDYALRFELLRRNQAAKQYMWVAEASAAWLGEISQGSLGTRELTEWAAAARTTVVAAKRFVGRYARAKAPTKDQRQQVSFHALRLARLDSVWRTRHEMPRPAAELSRAFLEPKSDEVAEVSSLLEKVPSGLGRNKTVLLNPTFGKLSELVGGADADLVLGATLIDIKTVQKAGVDGSMLRQLLGYMMLGFAARLIDQSFPRVDCVGIYFSRHAHLWRVRVSPIILHPRFSETLELFFSKATEARHARS